MESCGCPVHRAFTGMLRSDVACKACGHTSTVHDPTVGLSLDVPTTPAAASTGRCDDNGNGSGGGGSGSGGSYGVGAGGGITLEACLRLFARPEQLTNSESFPCARCGDVQQVKTKQMAVRRLPPVLALHLKRFEHILKGRGGPGGGVSGGGSSGGSSGDGVTVGRKIEAHVSFPFTLSMRPYCASATLRSRFGNRVGWGGEEEAGAGLGTEEAAAAEEQCRYDLFAVVVHSGSMESGHYIAYVQWQGGWFRCDDQQAGRQTGLGFGFWDLGCGVAGKRLGLKV